MPLKIEVCNPQNEWIQAGPLLPPGQSGSLSDNHDLGRDVYHFTCKNDDSGSQILRSKAGIDLEVGNKRIIQPLAELELITEIAKGQSYAMKIRTDNNPTLLMPIRFSHI